MWVIHLQSSKQRIFTHSRKPQYVSLAGGANGSAVSAGERQTAYAEFANDEKYDISLIVMGPADGATAKYVVDNVAEIRKDCMVFLSPELADAQRQLPLQIL